NATIHIRGKKRSNVLYIPENAVTQENGKSYVMIEKEDGFARVKEITVSGPIDGKYVVESGLEEGEEIVSE
ncbi:MAG: efflux transporter periplasmic adaptor subunit, partial [Clostridiales bacterium]|nr:efflux transporter periplasmic adaptor subunit [Clostridiales bacterium]